MIVATDWENPYWVSWTVPKQVIRQTGSSETFFSFSWESYYLTEYMRSWGWEAGVTCLGQSAQAHPPWLLASGKCQGQIALTSRMPWGVFRLFLILSDCRKQVATCRFSASVQIWGCGVGQEVSTFSVCLSRFPSEGWQHFSPLSQISNHDDVISVLLHSLAW